MTYRGLVKEGQIVVEELIDLPDGTPVQIEIWETPLQSEDEVNVPTLAERMSGIIGKAEGLPIDAAREHDHYLYGAPRSQVSP